MHAHVCIVYEYINVYIDGKYAVFASNKKNM